MEKYLHYNASEFSEDQSFIRWAKGSAKESDFDWSAWLAQHPEKRSEIEQAKAIVLAMRFDAVDVPTDAEDKVWSQIEAATSSSGKVISRRNLLQRMAYGAAAAIIIFLIATNIGGEYDTSYQTQLAQSKTLILPDGSTVTLNSESTLSFDKNTWQKDRKVQLDGEAFFEVKKGSKFTVKTDNGNVAVLGTSFNVYSRGKLLDVYCNTGKVGVTGNGKETILIPKQGVVVTEGNHAFTKVVSDQDRRSNWQAGFYSFKDADLRDVITELERQLDVKVKINSSLIDVKYTGSFNSKNPKDALSEVFWPLGLKYTQTGKVVTVTQ